MKTQMMKAALGTMVAAAILVASNVSEASVNFTAEELTRLQAGKTVKQPLARSRTNGFYGGTGWAIIDAPVDVVWAAIEDFGSYKKYYARTNEVKEVSRKGNRSLLRMELGYKMLSVTYHLNLVRDPEKKMIRYQLVTDRPHDIDDTRGYWRLFPQKDGRTLVAYVISVQVPMGLVNFVGPKIENQIERYLLGVPGKLKKWVEGPNGAAYHQMTARK